MIAQFALKLICGMSLFWVIMPRRDVTSGFFRIQMLNTLGLGVLSFLTLGKLNENSETLLLAPFWILQAITLLIAAISYIGSVLWMLERRRIASACGVSIFLLSAAAIILQQLPADIPSNIYVWLLPISNISSSATLGGAMVGMLLGHWYLTSPTMTTRPLNSINVYFAIALMFRLVVSGVGLSLGWEELAGNTVWVWLVLRWLAGIFGPLLMTFMVWRILKYRNTQSATGVLFTSVILTLIGELSATLLQQELGFSF